MQQLNSLEEIKEYCEQIFHGTFIKWTHNQITHTQVPKQNTYYMVIHILPPHDGKEEVRELLTLQQRLEAQGYRVKHYVGEPEERGVHVELVVTDKIGPLYVSGEEVLYGGTLAGPPTVFHVMDFRWSIKHKCFEYNIESADGHHKHLTVLERHISKKTE